MKNKPSLPVVVIGAGGHARVLEDALRLSGVRVIGLFEKDGRVLNHPPSKVLLANGVGSVSADGRRADIFKRFKNKGYRFVTVRHPSAVIAGDVVLGEGAQVMAGAVIQTGTVVGADTIINTGACVDHHCIIGAHVHIAPGAVLCGGVDIGEGSHIGAGAIVVQQVTIGVRSFIKAGTLVKAKKAK